MFRIVCLLLLVPIFPETQAKQPAKKSYEIKRIGKVDEALSEISGWVFVNDTTLIAHNDSGNEPVLYVLNLNGSVRSKCTLSGVKNVDFEDIATDGKGYIFLGDIGNNNNARKDLAVYRILTKSILNDSSATAEAIFFNYPEQKAFPPESSSMYYDAEALAYHNDSLWIVTKCRTKPFDGIAKIYSLPASPGKYAAKLSGELKNGKGGWLKDGITAADVYKGNFYLLTYNRTIICKPEKGGWKTIAEITMTPLSQKEALAVNTSGDVFITDERHSLIGGGTIFKLTKKP